ncbi:MAG: hypothetical protein NZ585_04045 [Chloracidobacterium sp.]|nr:hypothetical protein [Chloracidobacterium sp.]MDW8217471.1 hypothetical protein [Acidobacteriota bacterium]
MRFAHACLRTLQPPGGRPVIAAVCALAVTLPLLTTPFPPVTDLPQHVAQTRLWLETLRGTPQPNGVTYIVQWWTPYSLAYLVMGGLWQTLPPERVGQAMLLALALAWTLTTHWIATRRGRSAAAAALATTLFFNHTLYWGFVSFTTGFPLFLLWVQVTTTDAPATLRRRALLVGLAAALYAAHALWFALALLWFGVAGAALRRPWRTLLGESLWLLPPATLAAATYAGIGNATALVSHKTVWTAPIGLRLFTGWLPQAVYGGLRGPLEPVMLAVLGGWLAAGLARHRRRMWSAADPVLLLAGGMCLAAGLLLPYQYQYTIAFAERWMPAAAVLLLLGAPAPDAPPMDDVDTARSGAPLRVSAALLCVGFCLWTAGVWRAFTRDYLTGLDEALAALPSRPRVVGLDFVKEVSGFRGRPLMQTAAYAQVVRGGGYSLSFAKFPQSFVRYETDAVVRWTDGLEWSPEYLTETDLNYFDFVLAVGDRWAHERLAVKFPQLRCLTDADCPWRLYCVVR